MSTRLWEYFVPYQPDLEKVIRDLRQRVFDEGDYHLYIDLEPANEEAYLDHFDDFGTSTLEEAQRALQWFREESKKNPVPRPNTIEELIEWCGERGTQSIIDIRFLSDDPGCDNRFTAVPLSEMQLLDLFRTTKPTHSMIVKRHRALRLLHRWWQAVYITVYEKDTPTEVYFAGSSGR